MMQDYPISLSLKTKLAAESSISHCHIQGHIQGGNCGESSDQVPACTEFDHPPAHNEFSGAAWI
ncbi:MAG: hypothetical protein HYX37_02670 [Rhizobiales bacterium]|nr:hypothetical protein [Hyphomicrobiales bacterium]